MNRWNFSANLLRITQNALDFDGLNCHKSGKVFIFPLFTETFTTYLLRLFNSFHYSYTSRASRDKISTSVSCSFYYIFDISRCCWLCFASSVAFCFCSNTYRYRFGDEGKLHMNVWGHQRWHLTQRATFSILITRTSLIARSHKARNVTSMCTNWVHRWRKFRSMAPPLSYLDVVHSKVNESDAI